MTTINGSGRADVLRGTNGNDWIYGGAGDDRLDGLAGGDWLFGGDGRDTLNGGAGSDYVDGGLGDDTLVYSVTENKGAYDIYNGWFGNDTLRLVLTKAEWARADVKADVARFLAYLPEYNESLGWIDDPVFSFKSFGLSVVGVNKLEVVVDGKVVNVADAPVVTAADTLALGEDEAGATVDVLANDWAADGVKSVSIAQPANGRVEMVSTDFAGDKPSAVIRFVPGDAYQSLAAGETATEVFTYTVTDKDGDTRTETVTVTVTGANDGPVVTSFEDGVVSEDDMTELDFVDGELAIIAGVDGVIEFTDVDGRGGASVSVADSSANYVGSFTAKINDAGQVVWSFRADGRALDYLQEGEQLVQTYQVVIDDGQGGTATQAITVRVDGANDAPVVTAYEDGFVGEDETHGFDFNYETGVLTEWTDMTGSIEFADADAREGDTLTVTVADAPEGYLGRFTAELAEDGRVVWNFRVDNALLQSLGENEELVQTYDVTLDDGRGGQVTQAITVTVDGANDEIEREETDSANLVDNGNVRSGITRLYFSDLDLTDVHSATIAWRDQDNVGEVTASVVQIGEDGRGYVEVAFSFPIDEVEALPSDQLEQRYRVVISDGNGDTLGINRVVTLDRRVEWSIGGAGDDGIGTTSEVGNVLIGNGGRDQLFGDLTDDQLFGDFGPDLPAGEPDRLEEDNEGFGYPNYDEVFDDRLEGGGGADLLVGGAGADIFAFSFFDNDYDNDGVRDFTVAEGDVIRDFSAEEGDVLVFNHLGDGATFTRIDETHYEIANADRSIVEMITFENGADIPASSVFFYY